LVSIAGPAANMLLAFISLIVSVAVRLFIPHSGIVWAIINQVIRLNIIFAILNLIPIPPFDGYHIIKNLFYRRNVKFFWQYERYSLYVLFAFILLGVFKIIVGVPAGYIYQRFMWIENLLLIMLQ